MGYGLFLEDFYWQEFVLFIVRRCTPGGRPEESTPRTDRMIYISQLTSSHVNAGHSARQRHIQNHVAQDRVNHFCTFSKHLIKSMFFICSCNTEHFINKTLIHISF